jgi:hypothetical protein
MDLDEILENPAFWILGGGGIVAEVFGYIIARNQGWELMPFWQLIVIIMGTLVIAAFFAGRE